VYYIDVLNWLFAGNPAAEVVARGQYGVIKQTGYNTTDVTFALVTFADGAIANLSVCYALPPKYPALGHAARFELSVTQGVLILDDEGRSDHVQRAWRLPCLSSRSQR